MGIQKIKNIRNENYLSFIVCFGNCLPKSTVRSSIGRRSFDPKCSSISLLSFISPTGTWLSGYSGTWLWSMRTKMSMEYFPGKRNLRLALPTIIDHIGYADVGDNLTL